MIWKLMRSFKITYHSKNTFALLCCFTVFALLALNCQAQTKGGLVKNTIVQKPVPGNTYAIIFGVSNYPGLTPLRYADKDAALFRDFLETPAGGNTKPENIFFRTNDSAKAAEFNVKGYKWVQNQKLTKNDRLFIYFSGHGGALNEDNYFLLPYDCTPNNDPDNYIGTGNINMDYIKTRFIKPLTKIGVEVILIVDACRSIDVPGFVQSEQNFTNSVAEMDEGEIIMLSTGAGQVAVESPKIGSGHGLFTWHLIAGLSGEADKEGDAAENTGRISLAELTSYVKSRVRRDAKTLFNTDQVPVFLPPGKDLETIAMVDSGTYNNWKLAENMAQQTNGNGNMVAMVSKKAGKKAGIQSKAADSALIALDNKFIAAIKSGKLIGENSAEDFYNKMEEKWPEQSLTEDAKYSLATEFINFGQEKINLYLSGKGITHIQHLENAYKVNNKVSSTKNKDSVKNIPSVIEEQITRMKTIVSTGYDKAAEMMEKAVGLLKTDPELLEPLYPKLYFLKASSLQYSSNTLKKEQAIAFVKKAISKDVSAAYNYELLADLLNDVENDSCKIYYQKAIDLAPKWAYPENGLGNFYNDKRDYKLAIVHYSNAIKLDSLDEFVFQNIGSLYHNEAMPDSAKKYYLKALAINPCDFYACANLGSLYKDSINNKQKSDYYYKLSSAYLKKAIACNSSYAWAYNKLSQLFDQVNKGDSSLYYAKAGISKNPDNASLYRNLANEYFYQKDTLNAEKFYDKAVFIDSLDINNYTTLGWFYRKLGLSAKTAANPDPQKSFNKSVSNYQKAIHLDPGYKIAYNNLGLVYNDMKMFNKAILYYQKAIELDPGYALAYNNLGNVYYYQKAYDNAIQDYQKAIQFDSTFTSPYYNLGLIYDNLKAYDKAASYYNKAINLDSTDPSSYISLGDVYYQQKIYDKAIPYYQKAIRLDSLNTKAYIYLGDAYHQQKLYDKAILNYRKTISIDPANPAAYNDLGNIYYDQKLYDKAIPNYQKAISLDSAYTSAYFNLGLVYYNLKAYDKSVKYFQKVIHLDPADKTAYNSLGEAFHNQKNNDKALINYKKALELDSVYVKVYNNIGNVYYDQKAYDKAILNYQKTIRLDSTFTSAWYNLGLIYETQKNYEKAILYYQKAIKTDSAYSIAYLSLGDIYYNQKIYDKAILYYQKVTQVDPVNQKGYFDLGDVYHQQNEYDKAIFNYEKAIQIDSTYTFAYNNLGNVYYDQKIYDKAILNYQKAISLDSAFTSAYYNLGLIYNIQNDYDKSILNYQKAIHFNPADLSAYTSLGNVYRQQKLYDKAISNFQKAISLDSAYATAYYDLGLVYDDLKAYDKSIICYKKANAIDPDYAAYSTNLGYAYVYSGDFTKGIPFLEKALTKTTDNPWSYYNLACAWSLASNTDKGISYLKDALEKGFKDYDHIQQDNDIANLKKTQEFNTLMKQYFPDKVK